MRRVKLLAVLLIFTLISPSLSESEPEIFEGSAIEVDDYGSGVDYEKDDKDEVVTTKDTHATVSPFVDNGVVFGTEQTGEGPEINASENNVRGSDHFSLKHPAVLALIIGGIIFFLLIILLLIMFVVYRLRKKDEGSYALDENMKKKSKNIVYTKAPMGQNEFFA